MLQYQCKFHSHRTDTTAAMQFQCQFHAPRTATPTAVPVPVPVPLPVSCPQDWHSCASVQCQCQARRAYTTAIMLVQLSCPRTGTTAAGPLKCHDQMMSKTASMKVTVSCPSTGTTDALPVWASWPNDRHNCLSEGDSVMPPVRKQLLQWQCQVLCSMTATSQWVSGLLPLFFPLLSVPLLVAWHQDWQNFVCVSVMPVRPASNSQDWWGFCRNVCREWSCQTGVQF